MAKDRGIEHAQRCMTDIIGIIKSKAKKKEKIRILEAGCGYGVAMLDLVKLFGNNIEICGFNLKPKHGSSEIMKREALKKGIFSREQLKKINLPKIYYCDANKRLHFKNNTFDLIYSQASIYLYADKVHFLEECNRILAKGGIAIISPSFAKYYNFKNKQQGKNGEPFYYAPYWELWSKGKEIKFWDYLNKFKGIKVVWKKRGQRGGNKPMYIEIRKQKRLNFKLKLIASINLNELNKKWYGVKSIYTTVK